MTRAIKLRAREEEVPERKLRLRLPGSLVADLELYAQLYFKEHGHEIELPDLLLAIVAQFLASDRGFSRHKHGGGGTSPASAQRDHAGDAGG